MNTRDKIKAKGFKSIEEMSKVSGISVEAIKYYRENVGGMISKEELHDKLRRIEATIKIKGG